MHRTPREAKAMQCVQVIGQMFK